MTTYLRYVLTCPCLETGLGHDLHEKMLYIARNLPTDISFAFINTTKANTIYFPSIAPEYDSRP